MNTTPLHECQIRVRQLLSRRGVPVEVAREVEALVADAFEDAAPLARVTAEGEVPDFASQRYRQGVERGRGGMGSVYRVEDRWLGRTVAIKVLHAGGDERRFLAEARVTARLQHPNLLPVFELGRGPDGRLAYTLREVGGQALAEVLTALHAMGAAWAAAVWVAPDGARWTGRRVVEALRQVAEALAYAHDLGVLHRDVKPANILVGGYGEVYLVDWGLARACDAEDGAADEEVLAPAGLTRAGAVLGTPAYMAPEQASPGAAVGPVADVYGLGATLYHALSGQPPYPDPEAHEALAALRAGPPVSLRGRADLPEPLIALCEASMARDPASRLPSARAFAEALTAWLGGEQLRALAQRTLEEADALASEAAAGQARAAVAQAEAEAKLAGVPSWAPAEHKHAGWALQDEAALARLEAERAQVRMLERVQSALVLAPGLPEARDRLALHHRAAFAEAEARRDPIAAARHEEQLRAHDTGRYTGWLRGRGQIRVPIATPGATVQLQRYTPRLRQLVPEPWGAPTPAEQLDLELPVGSWRAVLTAPGCAPLLYPFLIQREQIWTGGPDGQTWPIRLAVAGALGPDEILVHEGPFLGGGGPVEEDPLPAGWQKLPRYAIHRAPITNAEYVAFLNDLEAQGRAEEALAAAPRERGTAVGEPGPPLWTRGDGRWSFGLDREGHLWKPDMPVVHISWHQAAAYCAWRAARTGQPWRLPTEREWEKAARGVDGRPYPWGDGFDPSFCCMRYSFARPEDMTPIPVDHPSFRADLSPYGATGMAGNVADWCADPWGAPEADGQTERMMRGGHWYSMPRSVGWRQSARPAELLPSLGFRPARSLEV